MPPVSRPISAAASARTAEPALSLRLFHPRRRTEIEADVSRAGLGIYSSTIFLFEKASLTRQAGAPR
jgi:hypothetical protein